MSYGLQCVNAGNELTFSSDGYVYGYIGKAVLQSITPPGTDPIGASCGFSTYTIEWPGDIIVAVGLPSNGLGTRLNSRSKVGTTWTITVFNILFGAADSLGFRPQVAADVYVWGLPTTTPPYGLAIYNAAGVLAGDLSRRPLSFNERVVIPGSDLSTSIQPYTAPAVIGYTGGWRGTSVFDSPFWINRIFTGAWMWESGLGLLSRPMRQTVYFRDDGPAAVFDAAHASNALLLEASGLT
jgi:hypothetical protein